MKWFYDIFTSKPDPQKTLTRITNIIISLEREKEYLQEQKNEHLIKIKRLIAEGRVEEAKQEYYKKKNFEDTITALNGQISILETNKIKIVEQTTNKVVYNVIKTVNKEFKSQEKYKKVENVIENNIELINEQKEVNDMLQEFVVKDVDEEFENLIDEAKDTAKNTEKGEEKEKVNSERVSNNIHDDDGNTQFSLLFNSIEIESVTNEFENKNDPIFENMKDNNHRNDKTEY
ncbi:hypothetical protein EDEG_01787 [Edhazardia aedis USNM 41457]|uniref:Uncharacterized protein n=1 Tax=Edhazardia aedis (strain USNM 41457) TaxID=1003232 RepID=J9DMX5_EDHAE|nr:hypothetical protein EDEG_01787 [Edhazardia aedis USNM 41457]|eukprot:EJW03920.1 hypothetical protein EDEG_01787 [Edhazardia aedis USNM 41457]